MTCGGRAAKSTRSGVSRSDRGKEHKTHNIRRIHTCLPYTSLETTSYPDRQEPQHTGLYHQPQEQALPEPVETLDGLSSTAVADFRKNLRIYPTRHRAFQLHLIPYRARTRPLRPATGKREGFGGILALSC